MSRNDIIKLHDIGYLIGVNDVMCQFYQEDEMLAITSRNLKSYAREVAEGLGIELTVTSKTSTTSSSPAPQEP
jgi:hypothetical protein